MTRRRPTPRLAHLEDHQTLVGHRQVLRSPETAAASLRAAAIYGLAQIDIASSDRRLVVFWLALEPWAAMAAEVYPTERVSVCVWADGQVHAIPHNARRRAWLHRNVDTALAGSTDRRDRGQWGALCLWFPGDPRPLRWDWDDGLDTYVTIVHRHLQAEEYWRRTGTWPADDAPHGGEHHPLRTPQMRVAADRWQVAC